MLNLPHSPFVVKRILIDCICFGAAHQRYFGVDTLKELFRPPGTFMLYCCFLFFVLFFLTARYVSSPSRSLWNFGT